MNLKQRFLTQSTIILIGTIVITCCFGFVYTYFYSLLSKSPDSSGVKHRAIVVMENDRVLYKSEDFSMFQIKEILMNISVETIIMNITIENLL